MSSRKERCDGSWAAYLDVEHPDIEDLCRFEARVTPSKMCLMLCVSATIGCNLIIDGDQEKRSIMAKIHKMVTRQVIPTSSSRTTVNKQAPKNYQEEGLRSRPQLCAEIMEYSDETKSFVHADLSSMNLLHFDERSGESRSMLLQVMMLGTDILLGAVH